jgi:hypothetical protein
MTSFVHANTVVRTACLLEGYLDAYLSSTPRRDWKKNWVGENFHDFFLSAFTEAVDEEYSASLTT